MDVSYRKANAGFVFKACETPKSTSETTENRGKTTENGENGFFGPINYKLAKPVRK